MNFQQRFNKINNKLILTVLILVCVIFLIFGVKEVYRIEYLFSNDPGFHMTYAKGVDSLEPFATHYPALYGEIKLQYPTLMRVSTVLINQITGISYIDIYKLFGLFARILTVFTIFIVVRYLVRNRIAALFASSLFLSHQYVFYRGLITYPENLVLPFHILIFYDVIRSIREKRIPITLPIFFAASLLIHHRSSIIPILLIGTLIAYKVFVFAKKHILLLKNKKKISSFFNYKSIVRVGVLLIIFLILSIPVYDIFYKQFNIYLQGNIGPDATWAPKTVGLANYVPSSLTFIGYKGLLGIMLFLLSLLSLPLILLKINAEKFILLVWIGFTFILTRGAQLYIYVPIDRMKIYFIVPLVIASAFIIKFIVQKHSNYKIFITVFLFIVIIFFQISTISQVHGWRAISNEETTLCSWINENIVAENSVIMMQGNIRYHNAGFEPFSSVLRWGDVFRSVFEDDIVDQSKLSKFFPDKSVYLVVTHKRLKEMDISDIEDYQVVYENSLAKIYQLTN